MRPDSRLVLALAALSSLAAPALEPVPLDLPSSLTLAARHNPDVRLAQERIREQQGVLVQVRSVRLPRVDASATYRNLDKNRIETFGNFPQNEQTYNVDLTASYTVYAGGAREANEAAAAKTLDAARAEVGSVVSGVLLQAGTFYFDNLFARQRALTQEEAIRVYEKQRDWADKRFKAGAGPELDVLRAEVAMANARPPLIRARNDERLALERLVEVIGLDLAKKLEKPFALDDQWPEAVPSLALADYERNATESRPEFRIARLHSLAALDRLKAAGATRLPQLDIYAGYGASGRQFNDSFGSPLDGWVVGAQAKWALWDSGLTDGAVTQAESRLAQAALQLDKLDLSISREVHEAWLSCQEAAEIRASSDTVIKTAREVLRQAEARFEAGSATQLDVLEAQFELTRAKLEHVQALYSANVSLLRLEQAAGLMESRVERPAKP